VEFDLRPDPRILLTAEFDRIEVDGAHVDGAFPRVGISLSRLGEESGNGQAERH
jgi:hypothetical protein